MKSQQPPAFSGISLLTLVLLSCTTWLSCSKKSDKAFIKAEEVIITNTDVNGCTVSSGATGTRFNYSIPYTTSPGITIVKVEWKSKFSNGNTNEGEYDVNSGTGGSVNSNTCIRYATTTWNERTYTLVGSNGVKSNPQTIKFNKPPGAE